MQHYELIFKIMADFIIKYRNLIIGIAVLLGITFLIFIPFARTDPEIRNYIPSSMLSRLTTDSIENEFGYQDMIMLIFTDSMILGMNDLEQVKQTDRALSRHDGISDRISPFTVRSIRSRDMMMAVDPLIGSIPEDTAGIRLLRAAIKSNRFAHGIVFSDDLTSAAITARLINNGSEKKILTEIDSICNVNSKPATILKGGLPVIRQHILKDVRKDAFILIPSALLIMLLVLKLNLGDWKSVFIPFSVVIISSVISLGLIPLLGWKMSIISLLVPIILIAVANNYGIYLVSFANDSLENDPGITNSRLTGNMMRSLTMPVLFSGLTTIAGLLGLLTHSVIPAKQAGILASSGVFAALLLSLSFIPALLCRRKKAMRGKKPGIGSNILKNIIIKTGKAVLRYPLAVLIIAFLFTITISSGIFLLKIETNQEKFFPANNPVRKASYIINRKFGGSQTVSVMISGDIKDPSVMSSIDKLCFNLTDLKGVGDVYSISQVILEMSKAIFNKGDTSYNSIPTTREAIAQMFELYYMSGDQADFRQLINPENTSAHILVKLSEPSEKVISDVQASISAFVPPPGTTITTGGYAVIMADFARLIFRGQVKSLILALSLVLILLAIIFRSLKAGIISSIPLASSILILFGFMGFAGIAIDAATALLSSIMIGVGVDFTIQFLWHFKRVLGEGSSYEDSVMTSMTKIGRSIMINALAVMSGFSVLIFSGFSSIRFFGYLVFISIGSCLAGALVIIPAILVFFRPSCFRKESNIPGFMSHMLLTGNKNDK